jgi:hypothetical protein
MELQRRQTSSNMPRLPKQNKGEKMKLQRLWLLIPGAMTYFVLVLVGFFVGGSWEAAFRKVTGLVLIVAGAALFIAIMSYCTMRAFDDKYGDEE